MRRTDYTMAIVLDPSSGERLRELAQRCDLWTVSSTENRPIVEQLWASHEAGTLPNQVTMWSGSKTPETKDEWLDLLDQIELHHGEHSHAPPVSVLEFYGAVPTPQVTTALQEYGYDTVELTPSGFITRRSARGRLTSD